MQMKKVSLPKGPVAPERKTTAPALMLRGIEEYGRGSLFVSRSIWVGSRLQKSLEGGDGMGAAGGFANAAGAGQAAEARVARRDAAACRAKHDEYATLHEDCPRGELSCWLALW